MSDVVPFHNGAVNPFVTAFQPAQRTLNALVDLRPAFQWLADRRQSGGPLFEVKCAGDLIELIPAGDHLASAGILFRDAVENAAPESWVHAAVGLALDSEPESANASDAVRFAIVDALYRDPETWQQHGPGVSAAVLVRAIRESRRLYDRLSPHRLIGLCQKHRREFAALIDDISDLMDVRWAAEDTLESQGLLKLTYDDDGED